MKWKTTIQKVILLETLKEYSEVWKDTQEYKEKKFREYLKDNTPFDEGLYCLFGFFRRKKSKSYIKGPLKLRLTMMSYHFNKKKRSAK